MGKKYEDFEAYETGQSGCTRMRTVGEPDIVNFAGVTCDYSWVHLAHHPTVDGPYGGRIAHGLLGAALAAGLLSLDAPDVVGRGVPGAYLCGFDANYRDAIRLGETVRIAWRISGKRDDPNQDAFGIVATAFEVITQEDRAVYDGTLELKVPKQSAQGEGVVAFDFPSPARWDPKEFHLDPEKAYFLQDFPLGEGGITSGRTITESDVVNFAGLTGDHNPAYVDECFAGQGPLNGRIVPGLLVFTMGFGLWTRDGEVMRAKGPDSSKDAGHLNDSSVFHRPVRIGDTIRCLYEIKGTRVSKTKPDSGIVHYGFQILNQHDVVVQEGKTLMMKSVS
jgi:acyl dehydratase